MLEPWQGIFLPTYYGYDWHTYTFCINFYEILYISKAFSSPSV